MSPNDPRLTAYALDELAPAERAEVEAALTANPALRRDVNEVRAAADSLTAALAAEPFRGFQGNKGSDGDRGVAPRRHDPYRIGRLAWAACLTASLSVGAAAYLSSIGRVSTPEPITPIAGLSPIPGTPLPWPAPDQPAAPGQATSPPQQTIAVGHPPTSRSFGETAYARQQAEQQRDEEIGRLLDQARTLQKDLRYDEASVLVNQALFLDSTNVAAQFMRDVLQDSQIQVNGVKARREQKLATAGEGGLNIEAATPYSDLITYPGDRPQLSDTRLPDTDGDRIDSEAELVGGFVLNDNHVASEADGFSYAMLSLRDRRGRVNEWSATANTEGVTIRDRFISEFAPPHGETQPHPDAVGFDVAVDIITPLRQAEANHRVALRLRESMPINFAGNRLTNVIDYLRNSTGANFFVNWPALEAAGVSPDAPITLQLSNIPAEQALRLVLRQARGQQPVEYRIIEGVVTISTQADLANIPHAPPIDREAYDRIVDNPFLAALDNPLSTFSIDVDTASYANVRRLLTSGQLPPPDAVRIEEMINYFNYDYAAPADADTPFAAHVEVAAAPWAPEHRLVRIGLKGMEVDAAERGPANLVFLIDVSGSMNSPDKLPLVKAGMKRLVGELRADDRVAIVVYAGASGLVLDSTTDHDAILAAIDSLQPGGSTNGAAGIELAYQIAQKHRLAEGVNRVILCTDGDFNVGVTDRGQLSRLIEEKAKSGVYLSVLGFGTGNLQDATMEELSNKGDGNYAYIDSEQEAQKVLVEQMNGTLVAIAKDVKIQVEFNPAKVAAYRLIGYENRILAKEDFNDDTKDAGDIGSGHTVTALYEVVPVASNRAEAAASGQDQARKQQRIVQLQSELAAVNARIIANDSAGRGDGFRTMELRLNAADMAELQRIQSELAALLEPASANRPADPLKYQQPAQLTPAAQQGNELLTLKLRYKAPDAPKEQGTSQLLEFAIPNDGKSYAEASSDFKFAASVAAFGMLLRNSPHKGAATYDAVLELATESAGDDPRRKEFVDLVARAKSLTQARTGHLRTP